MCKAEIGIPKKVVNNIDSSECDCIRMVTMEFIITRVKLIFKIMVLENGCVIIFSGLLMLKSSLCRDHSLLFLSDRCGSSVCMGVCEHRHPQTWPFFDNPVGMHWVRVHADCHPLVHE